MKKEIFESIKSGNVKKFYKSCEWIKKRKEILKRDNFECQKCKSEGSFSKAECVHHIKHLRKMPSLGLSESNLISLCNICHNKEHPEKFNQETKIKFVNEEYWE